MNTLVIVGIVMVVGGGAACLGAPSDNMNTYLIPGSIAVLLGAGLMIWGGMASRRAR